MIEERHADVHFITLPTDKPEVNGVDDLLAHETGGPEIVLELIAQAPQAKPRERGAKQSEVLDRIYQAAEFFQTKDQRAFASYEVGGHQETWPVKSPGFRDWLSYRFYVEEGRSVSSQALQDALGVCIGKARHEGAIVEIGLRIMKDDGGLVYLDLGNESWETVEIGPDGWRVLASAPVKFRRARGMMPLPHPVDGGALANLRPFLNAAEDHTWILLLSWLVGSMRPQGPYPILILQGEQGSAKSTTARVLRELVDPSTLALRSQPRDERDLMIAASNCWIISLDNLSGTAQWISDALCRLATGGGFATRELYSESEETLFDSSRPIILNGIDDIATSADLADRALIVTLPPISELDRRTEEEFWGAFSQQRTAIIGALLSTVSAALKNLPSVSLTALPRMADFAKWIVAAAPALPFSAESFLDCYGQNRRESVAISIEGSPVATAVMKFSENLNDEWKGTASDLLKELVRCRDENDEEAPKSKSWPKDPRALSMKLFRVAPLLRAAGTDIKKKKEGGTGLQKWTIRNTRKLAPQVTSSVVFQDNQSVFIQLDGGVGCATPAPHAWVPPPQQPVHVQGVAMDVALSDAPPLHSEHPQTKDLTQDCDGKDGCGAKKHPLSRSREIAI